MRFDRIAVSAALALSLTAGAVAPVALAEKAGQVRTESFRLLNQGVAAYRRGEFTEAAEKLRKSSSMALNSFRAYFYLGLALIGDRRYREAVDSLDVALDLDPTHLQALTALGDAYLKMGDITESRAAYFRAMKLRPEYPPALDGLARVEESGADTEQAISVYLRSIASDRGYAPAYTHLGDLFLRLNRFEEAVQLLEEAVAVRPDYAPGLNRLALAYGRLGLSNEAVATIQKAMQIQPNNPAHPATLGELQLEQGSILAAESSFLRALELDPGLPDARHGLAEVARRRGEYELALGQIDQALADPRMDARMSSNLEKFRERVETERDEIARLEQRVADGEAGPDEYSALALIYASRGMWDEAAALEVRGVPGPGQQERVAYMLFQAGRYREAHEIYAQLAAAERGASREVNDGVSLALLGDDEQAAAAFRRALEAEPENRTAQLYLANAMLRLGRRDEAAGAYKSFLDLGSGGEAAERVRRILKQIAPELLPPEAKPLEPPPEPPKKPDKKKRDREQKGVTNP